MSPSLVNTTASLISLLAGCIFVSMATMTHASGGEPGGNHGDPCGPTADNSLVCCMGRQQSTLIRRDERCCNGRPLAPPTLCCGNVTSAPRARRRNNACCLQPGATPPRGVTFDSRRSFCDWRTGRVRRIPFLGGTRRASNALATFRGHRLPGRLTSSRFGSVSAVSSSPSSSSPSSSVFSSFRRALAELSSSRSRSSSSSSSLVIGRSSSRLLPALCHADRQSGSENGEEELQCCGRRAYRPSRQTCCGVALHDLPSNQTQCCGNRAFLIGDSTNPCLGRCGARAMDRNTQLCCGGELHTLTFSGQRCCGTRTMNPRTHVCCANGQVAVHKERGEHGCCQDGTLYLRHYTQCSEPSDGLTRGPLHRKPVDFTARTLCRRALPTWGRHWPDVNVAGQVLHLEGQVTKVKRNTTHLQLTLIPFRIISPNLARRRPHVANFSSPCLARNSNARLRVIVDLRDGAGRTPADCHGQQLRRYLNGSTLTTLSPLNTLDCSNRRGPFLHIPSRSPDSLLLKKEPATV